MKEEQSVRAEANIRAVSIISGHIMKVKSLEVVELLTRIQQEILSDEHLIQQ